MNSNLCISFIKRKRKNLTKKIGTLYIYRKHVFCNFYSDYNNTVVLPFTMGSKSLFKSTETSHTKILSCIKMYTCSISVENLWRTICISASFTNWHLKRNTLRKMIVLHNLCMNLCPEKCNLGQIKKLPRKFALSS